MDDEKNPFEDHELVVTYGDCELWGRRSCGGATFGSIRPNQSLDEFAGAWERHSMAAVSTSLRAEHKAGGTR